MVMFRKRKMPECLDNNEEAEINEVDCFLCQEVLKSCEYDEHLEKLHGVIFGLKEIKKARGKCQSLPPEEPDNETGETEPQINRTDADTVKELVNMRYLSNKKKTRLRSPRLRIFSRKYKNLLNEEQELPTL